MSDDFGATFTVYEYENEPLIQVPALVVCEDDDAPVYETDLGSFKHLSKLTSSGSPLHTPGGSLTA